MINPRFGDEILPEPIPYPPRKSSRKKLLEYLSNDLMPAFDHERCRLQKFEDWATGRQPEAKNLQQKNKEKLLLQRLARNPWMPLMVSTFAQQLRVDGYRKEGSTENEEAWDTWQFNEMAAQELSINRAVITYGYAYLRVTAGEQVAKGRKMAALTGVDPQNALAIYADPYSDEYPEFLLERRFNGTYRWWTEDSYLILTWDGSLFKFVEEVSHNLGVVPFVRYVNQIDLKGRCWGDVEPLMELAARLDKTAFDRLLTQHWNSFKIRYGTGLEQPDSEEGVAAEKIKLSNEAILLSSNPEAKFGTLDETNMAPFIQAYESDLKTFLAAAQLPPDLAGLVANLAADALEGARRSTYQKLIEKQVMLGKAHSQALRLAAQIEGRDEDAEDFSAQIHWQDTSVISLAQFADAWGKIADQLGVPKEHIWPKIPGVDQSEVAAWKEGLLSDEKEAKFLRELNIKPAGQAPGPGGPNSTRNQPKPNE